MKTFALYTAARLALFVVAFALVWAVLQFFVDWGPGPLLVTGAIAVFASSIASLFLLRGLREDLARGVQARAERMTQRLEATRSREDTD